MKDEAMKLALEAISKLRNQKTYWWQEVDEDTLGNIEKAEMALEEALAKQEQGEPVAWFHLHNCEAYFTTDPSEDMVGNYWTPLYTTPPQSEARGFSQQRKPLTDEQIEQMWERTGDYDSFSRAIEAAHGIKE